MDGPDALVACIKFEPRVDVLSEQFQKSITKWDAHIKHVVQEREEVIKRTQQFFTQQMEAMLKLSIGNVEPVDGLQAAIRTIRKVPIFKDVHDAAINFEWPTKEQIVAMPRGKSYSLRRVLWKPF